jgi:hypothetical protein
LAIVPKFDGYPDNDVFVAVISFYEVFSSVALSDVTKPSGSNVG